MSNNALMIRFFGLFIGLQVANGIAAVMGLDSFSFITAIKLWVHYKGNAPTALLIASGAGLVVFIVIFLFAPSGSKNKYGSALWAKKRDAKEMGLLNGKGIILGDAFGDYLRVDKNLSIAIIAPPGTGKSAGSIIPTLLSCGNSMAVFDVKGELHAITAKHRATFSKVLRFAPVEDDTCHWNPLDKTVLPDGWADVVQTVERTVATLIPMKDDSDYWNSEARSVFVFFALYLIHRNGGGTSLPEIRAFALSLGAVQEWIEEILIENDDKEEGDKLPIRVVEEGNSLLGKADKEFSGVFGSFKKSLNVFGDERIAAATSKSDFTPDQLRTECTTIYIEAKAEDIDRLAPLVRLFFESTSLYLLSVAPQNKQGLSLFDKAGNLFRKIKKTSPVRDQDITLVLDEFVRLGKMPVIMKNPALSRGNRFNTIFVAQDWGQVRELYGEGGVSELETTTAYKVIFQQNNYDTAERVSKAIGDKTQSRESQSRSRSGTSKSTSEEGARLIRAQEITELPSNECLILAQGFMSRPIKAKVCFWFNDPVLKKLGVSTH